LPAVEELPSSAKFGRSTDGLNSSKKYKRERLRLAPRLVVQTVGTGAFMKQPVKIGHLFMLSEHRLFWSTRYVKRKLIVTSRRGLPRSRAGHQVSARPLAMKEPCGDSKVRMAP
jgi:hypothetical protein